MSSDSQDGKQVRSAQRRDRAIRDVHQAHAALLALGARFADEAWERPCLDGWSPAEVCLHALLILEQALGGLRVMAASGIPENLPGTTLRKVIAKRVALVTWRLPADMLPHPSSNPSGVILPPQAFAQRCTSWASDYIQFLRDQSPAYLENLVQVHPRLGSLNAFEWARFARIYIRHQDLRLKVGQG